MRTRLFTGAIAALLAFSGVHAMQGKAAAVVNRNSGTSKVSRLILANVSDNSFTSDTIVRNDAGGMYFPTFNLDGTRIAFYKNGAGVCVYDLANKSLRTVARVPDAAHRSAILAWPGSAGGMWVYYQVPCSSCRLCQSSGAIWKVNVDDTTKKSLVCDYAKWDTSQWIQRWSLSADGRYSVVHAGTIPGDPTVFGGGIAHAFPPLFDAAYGSWNPMLTAVKNCCIFQNECNQGIMASGKLLLHFSGQHNAVYGENWDHTTNAEASRSPRAYFTQSGLETWLAAGPGPSPAGGDGELMWPRGASNSDRIMTVLYWTCCQNETAGDNLAVVNWKVGQAVSATKCVASTGWWAEPGDFHLDGGPANSYQTEDGSWVAVPPSVHIRRGSEGMQSGIAGGIAARTVTIYNLRGARAAAFDASASTWNKRTALDRGLYIVCGRGITEKAVMLDNGASGR